MLFISYTSLIVLSKYNMGKKCSLFFEFGAYKFLNLEIQYFEYISPLSQ